MEAPLEVLVVVADAVVVEVDDFDFSLGADLAEVGA